MVRANQIPTIALSALATIELNRTDKSVKWGGGGVVKRRFDNSRHFAKRLREAEQKSERV